MMGIRIDGDGDYDSQPMWGELVVRPGGGDVGFACLVVGCAAFVVGVILGALFL